ncbi:hypothetical protein MRX96_028145 [Rhipicephalus microplus]
MIGPAWTERGAQPGGAQIASFAESQKKSPILRKAKDRGSPKKRRHRRHQRGSHGFGVEPGRSSPGRLKSNPAPFYWRLPAGGVAATASGFLILTSRPLRPTVYLCFFFVPVVVVFISHAAHFAASANPRAESALLPPGLKLGRNLDPSPFQAYESQALTTTTYYYRYYLPYIHRLSDDDNSRTKAFSGEKYESQKSNRMNPYTHTKEKKFG